MTQYDPNDPTMRAIRENQEEMKAWIRSQRGNQENTIKELGLFAGALKVGGVGLLAVGEAAKLFTGGVQQSLSEWQAAGKIGIGFGKDMVLMQTSIAATRMSVEEFTKAFQTANLNNSFATLAGGMKASGFTFAKLNAELTSSADWADSLGRMGYKADELGEVMGVLVGQGTRLKESADRKDLVNATANLAAEMVRVTEATGLSRQAQLDALKKQQDDQQMQLARRDLDQKGTENAQKLVTILTASGLDKLGTLGAKFGSTGLTQDQATEASFVLGNQFNKFMDNMKIVNDGTKSQMERDLAASKVLEATAAVSRENANKDRDQQLLGSNVSPDQQMRGLYDAQIKSGQSAEAQRMRKEGYTDQQAFEFLKNQYQNKTAEEIKKEYEPKTGGEAVTAAAVGAQRMGQDTVVAMAKGVGAAVELAIVKGMATALASRLANEQPGNPRVGYQRGGILPQGIEDTSNAALNGQLASSFPTILKDQLISTFQSLKNVTTDAISAGKILWNGQEMMIDPTTGRLVPKFIEGTDPFNMLPGGLSSAGSWFRDFGAGGTFAQLDGKEAVVPEGKKDKFIADNLSPDLANAIGKGTKNIQTGVGDISNVIAGVVGDVQKSFNPGQLQGMLNSFQSTMAPQMENFARTMPQQLNGITSKLDSSIQGIMGQVQNTFNPDAIAKIVNTTISSATAAVPRPESVQGPQLNPSTVEDIRNQLVTLNSSIASRLDALASTMDKQYSALKSQHPDLLQRG